MIRRFLSPIASLQLMLMSAAVVPEALRFAAPDGFSYGEVNFE